MVNAVISVGLTLAVVGVALTLTDFGEVADAWGIAILVAGVAVSAGVAVWDN